MKLLHLVLFLGFAAFLCAEHEIKVEDDNDDDSDLKIEDELDTTDEEVTDKDMHPEEINDDEEENDIENSDSPVKSKDGEEQDPVAWISRRSFSSSTQ
ncbi:uncharacterized protein LOC130629115 isoform X1 [Hydractinia symbiolongicarpus]|uniref:uncharacterized protein LOC130629115 isoform X1 n=1 Tax=Hydractinia symbiolongicarpus TaxID=13093 RepID=UPI00254DC1A3|nr:uncharacterized protein LOC130629115 isoform X1 [Hydractinia symbiolongicarpus]